MKLTFLEQDIIELLIFEPRSPGRIAKELNEERFVIKECLESLEERGLVRLVYARRNPDNPPTWDYCGGSVSEFFSYTLTKGAEDGQKLYA